MLDRLRGLFRRLERKAPPEPASTRALSLAPAVVLVCGAGVAFWWYTQWAHGRGDGEAEAEPHPGVGPVLPADAGEALDAALAVQAAAEPSAAPRS